MNFELWVMGLGLLGGVLEPVAAIVGGVCQAGRIIRSQVVVDGFPGDTTPGLACGGISFCLEHLFGDIGEEEEGGGGACECTITNGGQEEAKLVVGAAEDDFFEGGALLVVRKFFIGSREVFCYRFERGIEKNVIFVT